MIIFTYPNITKNLEFIFSTFENEYLVANMLYGTSAITVPDREYSAKIRFTLSDIEKLNSFNCLNKEGNHETLLYSRGLVVLAKHIYFAFSRLFNYFLLNPPSFYSIVHSLSDLENPRFIEYCKNSYSIIKKLLKERNERIQNGI